MRGSDNSKGISCRAEYQIIIIIIINRTFKINKYMR